MSDLQHQRIDALCQELRLCALASLYGPIAQDAAKRKNASYADFLEEALRAERDARRVRSREMLTRTAGFPAIKTLEDYDFGFATGAPRGQILEVAALGFVERTENVVLLGPSGAAVKGYSTPAIPTYSTDISSEKTSFENTLGSIRFRPTSWSFFSAATAPA
jgi:DNA replication protein DnaC